MSCSVDEFTECTRDDRYHLYLAYPGECVKDSIQLLFNSNYIDYIDV